MIELAGRRIGEALNRIRARGLPLGQVGELTELSVAQAKRLGAAATGQTGRHRRPGRAALDRGGGGREPVRWSPPLGEGRPRAASRGGWNCRRWAACSPATVVCRPRGRRTAMRLVMDRGRQGCCGGPGRRPVARRPCAATVPRWSARGGGISDRVVSPWPQRQASATARRAGSAHGRNAAAHPCSLCCAVAGDQLGFGAYREGACSDGCPTNASGHWAWRCSSHAATGPRCGSGDVSPRREPMTSIAACCYALSLPHSN